jgi:hypothetical protein
MALLRGEIYFLETENTGPKKIENVTLISKCKCIFVTTPPPMKKLQIKN